MEKRKQNLSYPWQKFKEIRKNRRFFLNIKKLPELQWNNPDFLYYLI